MSSQSFIYTGTLHHRRTKPRPHDFRYSIAMLYVDLSEVKQIFRLPFLFSWKPSLVWFRRADYLKGQAELSGSVRDLVEAKLGKRPSGAIRMLTQVRYFGFCFNPVTFYYCFDVNEKLKFIVSEITNTPWNERHAYVHEVSDENEDSARFEFKKDFHVSPFLPMDLQYVWQFSRPSPAMPTSRLRVRMEDWDQSSNEKIFEANLILKAKPATPWNLAKLVLGFPLLTLKTFIAIYFQALRLKMKGAHFYSHPQTGERS